MTIVTVSAPVQNIYGVGRMWEISTSAYICDRITPSMLSIRMYFSVVIRTRLIAVYSFCFSPKNYLWTKTPLPTTRAAIRVMGRCMGRGVTKNRAIVINLEDVTFGIGQALPSTVTNADLPGLPTSSNSSSKK